MITDRILFPTVGGQSIRIVTLIQNLRNFGFEVILISPPGAGIRGRLHTRLIVDRWLRVKAEQFKGGNPADYDISAFTECLKKSLLSFNPVAVVAEYVYLAPCLDIVNNSLKFIDTHDVAHKRKDWLTCDKQTEASLLKKADVIIAIQTNEKKIFRKLVPGKKIITLMHSSNVIKTKHVRTQVVGLIGSYSASNSTIYKFADEIWPTLLNAVPNAELQIYGGLVRGIKNEINCVKKIGFVKELHKVYNGISVVINPVTQGTGLKIKTVEALCHGKALVTTSVGADGLEEGAGKAFIMTDDMKKFGKEVVRLLKDDKAREELEKNALEFAKKNFTREVVMKELLEVLDEKNHNHYN